MHSFLLLCPLLILLPPHTVVSLTPKGRATRQLPWHLHPWQTQTCTTQQRPLYFFTSLFLYFTCLFVFFHFHLAFFPQNRCISSAQWLIESLQLLSSEYYNIPNFSTEPLYHSFWSYIIVSPVMSPSWNSDQTAHLVQREVLFHSPMCIFPILQNQHCVTGPYKMALFIQLGGCWRASNMEKA